ncbi:MAG: MFS transporter [Dehalococcoidales bacterium]|nr:MAG: MFS transporter [Dehalococcoidales bacterium]
MQQISRREKLFNVPLIIICQSFQALSIGGIALFLPLIREDLTLTFTQGGTLAAATTLVYALMQIPAGYLADRFGGKRLFVIGILGTTILSLTFGFVTEYWQALINQAVSGLFRAFLFAPGIRLISAWFSPDRRATAMGLYLIGGFLGNLIIDIAGPVLVAEYGWRFPFQVFPPLGIILSLVLWRFGKEPYQEKPTQEIGLWEVLQLFKHRLMWVCGGIQYVRLAVMMGITFWLPTLLVEEKGLSLQFAGVIIAVQAAFIAPSNVIGGYISDKLRNPISVIATSLLVLTMTTVSMVLVDNIILLVTIIIINSIFIQAYFGPLFSIPVDVLGERTTATSTGFGNLFANLGAFSFTYLLGILKDISGSFLSGFVTIAISCIFGFGLTIVLAKIRRKTLLERGSN